MISFSTKYKTFLASFILFIVCSNFAFSQSGIKDLATPRPIDSAYTAAYNKLKKLYLERLDTEVYKNHMRLYREFRRKMHFEGDPYASKISTNPISWIKKNLERTEFTSIEEAENEWETCVKANKDERSQNREFHEFETTSMLNFGYQIVTKVIIDLKENHHEKLAFWYYEK